MQRVFSPRRYPSILSFKTINKLKLFFECGIPRPQDADHLCLRNCKYFNPFIISIAVLENGAPDAGLQKRATFFNSKHRSGRDRESNPGNLREKQRH
jgi:hypothetical protein